MLTKTKIFNPLLLTIIIAIIWTSFLGYSKSFSFSYDDNSNQFLTFYVHNWNSLVKNKEIPLINMHQYLGQTYLAQGQTGVLYPPVYLAVTLSKVFFNDIYHTIDIIASLHLVAAAALMYLLLKQMKASSTISLLSSLLWITFPYIITVTQSWIFVSYLAAFIPLNFLFLEKLIAKPCVKNAFYLAVVKTLFFFSGYVNHFFILLVLEGLFMFILLLAKFYRGYIKKMLTIAASYVLSLTLVSLLISPLLMPMIQTKLLSAHRTSSIPFNDFIANSLKLDSFLKAQQILFHERAVFHASSHIFYTGPFVLALLLPFLIRRLRTRLRSRQTIIYLALALIAFMLSTSLNQYTYGLPLFSSFRWPQKYFMFFLFFLTIALTGIATAVNTKKTHLAKQAIYALLITSIGLNVAIVWKHRANTFDYWRHEVPSNTTTIENIDKNKGRVISYQISTPKNQVYKYLLFNNATLFDVNHIGGYDPLVAKKNLDLSLGLNYKNNYTSSIDQSLLDYLSDWSVKYIITSNSSPTKKHLDEFNQLNLLYQDTETLLYDNTASKPYVHTKNDPAQTIPFNFKTNGIDIFPINKNKHELIINIVSLSNYRYFADNKKISGVPVTKNRIKLSVPANTNKLTIKYVDDNFIVGVILSLSTLIIISIYLLLQTSTEKRFRQSSLTLNKPGNNK